MRQCSERGTDVVASSFVSRSRAAARGPARRRPSPGGRGDQGRGRGRGRGRGVSLKLTTGKMGRRSQVSMRRGNLKRKDRTQEKALREERARERNTVQLPG